jgi:hypothetical protein
MDPRFIMAWTYEDLRKAGISADEFEKEINNCEGPDHAIEICIKWRGIASEKFTA